MKPVFRDCLYSNYNKWFTSAFQIKQGMQQNIIPIPTSKLAFKVQFFAETYFRVFKSFAKIAKIRSSRKFPLIRYWKEKETHIHFCCYLYQRCINCVNESLFEISNIHVCTHNETFLCKDTICLSSVNGKGERGYVREIQAVLNCRKNWFFTCCIFG